jgi:hypothetical protein
MPKVSDEDRKHTYSARGRQRDILSYFWAHPGKVLRIEELEKHFKDKYNRNQIMATLAHVCSPAIKEKYNYPIERLSQGVWKLVESTYKGEVKQEPTKSALEAGHILVEVLKEKPEFLLVEDTEDGKIYKMYLVG